MEFFNAVILEKLYVLCSAHIVLYNKMTIKQQNDAIYGRNNSIIFLFHLSGRLAP